VESSGNTPLERWYPSAGTTGLTQLVRLGVADHRLFEEALQEAVVAARPRLAVILVARRLGRRGRRRGRLRSHLLSHHLPLRPQLEQLAVADALQPLLHRLRPQPLLAWGGGAAQQLHQHRELEPAPFRARALVLSEVALSLSLDKIR
jgi:hypothetical protein